MEIPQINLIEAYAILRPLALLIVALAVYSVFIFKFYRFLARRDIIVLDLEKHNRSRLRAIRKLVSFVFYVWKFLILFPVFTFFWYMVLTALLLIMAKDQEAADVMLISMVVVGGIRFAAYYNEALSTDIAKILPFAMLGIMIIDSSYLGEFTREAAFGKLGEAATNWENVIYYLIAIVLLEFVLRITYRIIRLSRSITDKSEATAISDVHPVTEQETATPDAQPATTQD